MEKKEKKPHWVTEEQWKAVPCVAWWEDRRRASESIARQKPVTVEEARAQFSRLRNEKNWSQGA